MTAVLDSVGWVFSAVTLFIVILASLSLGKDD